MFLWDTYGNINFYGNVYFAGSWVWNPYGPSYVWGAPWYVSGSDGAWSGGGGWVGRGWWGGGYYLDPMAWAGAVGDYWGNAYQDFGSAWFGWSGGFYGYGQYDWNAGLYNSAWNPYGGASTWGYSGLAGWGWDNYLYTAGGWYGYTGAGGYGPYYAYAWYSGSPYSPWGYGVDVGVDVKADLVAEENTIVTVGNAAISGEVAIVPSEISAPAEINTADGLAKVDSSAGFSRITLAAEGSTSSGSSGQFTPLAEQADETPKAASDAIGGQVSSSPALDTTPVGQAREAVLAGPKVVEKPKRLPANASYAKQFDWELERARYYRYDLMVRMAAFGAKLKALQKAGDKLVVDPLDVQGIDEDLNLYLDALEAARLDWIAAQKNPVIGAGGTFEKFDSMKKLYDLYALSPYATFGLPIPPNRERSLVEADRKIGVYQGLQNARMDREAAVLRTGAEIGKWSGRAAIVVGAWRIGYEIGNALTEQIFEGAAREGLKQAALTVTKVGAGFATLSLAASEAENAARQMGASPEVAEAIGLASNVLAAILLERWSDPAKQEANAVLETKSSSTKSGSESEVQGEIGASSPKTVLSLLQKTCFLAGTPILTPDGQKTIENFKTGDLVLSRPENEPSAPPRVQAIETVFRLKAPVLEVYVAQRKIETTGEHPFYVVDRGWVPAHQLQSGDVLIGHNAVQTAVERTATTDRIETVYNLRVTNDHTYFVGSADWGFSVWVHNAYSVREISPNVFEIIDDSGATIIGNLTSKNQASALADVWNSDPNTPVGTAWGWTSQNTWNKAVREVAKGGIKDVPGQDTGVIKSIDGKVPTLEEGVRLIRDAGGTIQRIDPPHTGSLVAGHVDFPHINYTTAAGKKGHLQIQDTQ